MIAIIDYSTGNIRSVTGALDRLDVKYVLTSDHSEIAAASHIILPGVGEASRAMAALCERNLDTLIPTLRQPLLGVCIGMQLLCKSSEEGSTQCMGVFDTQVQLLKSDSLKIPHMGWDSIGKLSTPLFDGIAEGAYIYYVHSYAATLNTEQTIAVSDYTRPFSAALNRDNFYGCQFHPEKSGAVGARLLSNFINL